MRGICVYRKKEESIRGRGTKWGEKCVILFPYSLV